MILRKIPTKAGNEIDYIQQFEMTSCACDYIFSFCNLQNPSFDHTSSSAKIFSEDGSKLRMALASLMTSVTVLQYPIPSLFNGNSTPFALGVSKYNRKI